MYRQMLKSKIHRARVVEADLHYVGSLTVDAALLDAADLLPGEKVDVLNITTGSRFTTYLIEGARDGGVIGVNGAAARLASPGDLVIIVAYALLAERDAKDFEPRVVFVDENNRLTDLGTDPAHAPEGSGLVSGGRTP